MPLLDSEGLSLQVQDVDTETILQFDLSLSLTNTIEGLRGSLMYNANLFEEATIVRMTRHLLTFLKAAVVNPTQHIWQLPLLAKAELHQLLVEWNDTQTDYPKDQCICEMFESQVELMPDAVAVVFGQERLTYLDLNHRANQLAHHLQTLGVGLEDLVAICVERSIDMVVGLLGILKAGAAYVPLDPTYPQERLVFMLTDTQAQVLLTQEHLLATVPTHARHTVCLDRDWAGIAQESTENIFRGVTPANLAYVIYTSGSTGTPKGVMIDHKGMLNLIFWHQRAFAVSSRDRATQVAGVGFDAAVWELWPYLAVGACIYLVNDEIRTSPMLLRDWLVEEDITLGFLPTPMAEAIVGLEWPSNIVLRTLLTGGDALHSYPSSSLPFTVVNNYGPTENTVVTTYGVVPSCGRPDAMPSIGRPISNTEIYVLDRYLQPVPIGVLGELYVCGDGLACGYLNRADFTAERFIPHPFSSRPGARLYKTGDVVRYQPDGSLDYLGRNDYQVKIRGFRIELGEIEAALEKHSAVREAVMLTRDDGRAARQLVAYVVFHHEQRPTSSELRSFLKRKLPDYMVPSEFITLEAIPLTPNGKVDLRGLPETDSSSPELDAAIISSTTIEQQLTEIWAQVLGLKHIGINDNFFGLGGHSLLAAQVIAHVSDVLHVTVPVNVIFEAPTVAGLARIIEQRGLPLDAAEVRLQPLPRGNKTVEQVVEELEKPLA